MTIFRVAALVLSLTAPAMAQAVIPALPGDMIGAWGYEAADCKDENSDGRLTVEPKRVASFVSVFKLGEIRKLPDGSVKAAATRFDEGEQRRPRASLELKLVTPDRLRLITGGGETITYLRCKAPGKAR